MDVGARAGDFKYKSGLYEMVLIVGDASLSNSFEWHVANLDLDFPHNVKGKRLLSIGKRFNTFSLLAKIYSRHQKATDTISITRNNSSIPNT